METPEHCVKICLKFTILKIPSRCQRRRSGVFIVNIEHISHISRPSSTYFTNSIVVAKAQPNNVATVKHTFMLELLIGKGFKNPKTVVILVSYNLKYAIYMQQQIDSLKICGIRNLVVA